MCGDKNDKIKLTKNLLKGSVRVRPVRLSTARSGVQMQEQQNAQVLAPPEPQQGEQCHFNEIEHKQEPAGLTIQSLTS